MYKWHWNTGEKHSKCFILLIVQDVSAQHHTQQSLCTWNRWAIKRHESQISTFYDSHSLTLFLLFLDFIIKGSNRIKKGRTDLNLNDKQHSPLSVDGEAFTAWMNRCTTSSKVRLWAHCMREQSHTRYQPPEFWLASKLSSQLNRRLYVPASCCCTARRETAWRRLLRGGSPGWSRCRRPEAAWRWATRASDPARWGDVCSLEWQQAFQFHLWVFVSQIPFYWLFLPWNGSHRNSWKSLFGR